MKKTLVSALTTALVVGAASTTFAAANPFSDVPADHWAYDAVTQLAADGVINGYGDGTFRGDRNITRYEMAQMVAKAMAKTDISAKDKALIDKLAAEFSDELNNLGVRVSNLEKHADMVKWTGKLEYTYHSRRGEDKSIDGKPTVKDNSDGYVFRLEPQAEVNEHWTVNARLDAEGNMKHDNDNDNNNSVRLKRAWAQGNYNNFQVKLGKFEFCPSAEHGLLWDTEVSGVELTVGKDFKGV
ncbi:MAG: S-layer homology domain-containing protein, partial [Selenomonadaceae bacterium]|nr:S-layer homology domain-containing protein [Selenomonadaceae bacterium]